MATYYLFETASGYSLFEGKAYEQIGGLLESVQESIHSYKRFKKLVKLNAFLHFCGPGTGKHERTGGWPLLEGLEVVS
jgi:hypothetical protein